MAIDSKTTTLDGPLPETEPIEATTPGSNEVSGFLVSDSAVDPKILIIDDDPLMVQLIETHLRQAGYREMASTTKSLEAIRLIVGERPDVVLLDIHMPLINGLDILEQVSSNQATAGIPVIILTASTEDDLKLQALRLGAVDFLHKPVHAGELLARLRNILMAKGYQDYLRNHSEMLEAAVSQRTAELETSRRDVIHCLARAAEFRDDDTGQHILRVGRYARLIGEQLGLGQWKLEVLELAAQLHDVGKIGIPDAILHKPGKLTPEEFEIMQEHCHFGKQIIVEKVPDSDSRQLNTHTELGAWLLSTGDSPILEVAMSIALTHHERWDGSGYPAGLKGEQIPLEGRITAVADVFDALSSKRPYKPAFPIEKCLSMMQESRGTHFDPTVLDAFFAKREQIAQVQITFADPA